MKILFAHIPKCSGTNTSYQLDKLKNEEYVWYVHKILKYDADKYDEYYKFSIIRDPVEKLMSMYFYSINMINSLSTQNNLTNFQEGNWNVLNDLYKKYDFFNVESFLMNFNAFYDQEIKPNIKNLKKISETKCMTYYYLVGFLPQHLFICDNNGKILVDDVVNIKNVDKFLNKTFGINNNSKLNTHQYTEENYKKYLSDENIKMIKSIYSDDYKYLFDKIDGDKIDGDKIDDV
jgi:hypothetical protein